MATVLVMIFVSDCDKCSVSFERCRELRLWQHSSCDGRGQRRHRELRTKALRANDEALQLSKFTAMGGLIYTQFVQDRE